VLTSFSTSGGLTTVHGTLHGAAGSHYEVYLDLAPQCDPSGYGEGRPTGLEVDAYFDSNGDSSFQRDLPAVPIGTAVTAVAYRPDNQAGSEFSNCLRVAEGPVATTAAADGVGTSGGTLAADVDPRAADTSVRFEYGLTSSYGSTTASQDAGNGVGAQHVTAALGGLAQGTTFHYRVIATNAYGTSTGEDRTFTTSVPAAPKALSPGATNPGQGGGNGGKDSKPGCVVPKLKGKNLAAVRTALAKAHCKLGKVSHKHKHGARKGGLLTQGTSVGKHLPAGAKVAVVLDK
jgi:hypothetical protein